MTGIQYRQANMENVPDMTHLFLLALGDLYTRNNICIQPPPRSVVLNNYEHICTTGMFHTAEADGQIVAIAGARC